MLLFAAPAPRQATEPAASGVLLSNGARRGDLILLQFAGALDATTATEAAHYEIRCGEQAVSVLSVAYFAASQTVALEIAPQSTLEASALHVAWHDLRDARGRTCSGETILVDNR